MNSYQKVIEQQDDHVEEINEIAGKLKINSLNFNQEIQRQRHMINQLDQQVDTSRNKLGIVGVKLQNLLQTDDTGQVCTALMMAVFSIVLIALIIIV